MDLRSSALIDCNAPNPRGGGQANGEESGGLAETRGDRVGCAPRSGRKRASVVDPGAPREMDEGPQSRGSRA